MLGPSESTNLFFAEDKEDDNGSPHLNMVDDDLDDNEREDPLDDYEQKQDG